MRIVIGERHARGTSSVLRADDRAKNLRFLVVFIPELQEDAFLQEEQV